MSSFMSIKISSAKTRRVLEMDGGDGCSMMSAYSAPLNCALEMVNYVICVLYHTCIFKELDKEGSPLAFSIFTQPMFYPNPGLCPLSPSS